MVRVQEEERKSDTKVSDFLVLFYLHFLYYIYILYSPIHDKYYVGYTSNIAARLDQHNNSLRNTFTSKYRPWRLAALFESSNSEGETMKIEKFIKKQKSRNLLKKMISGENLNGLLAQLVRVP